MRAHPAGTCPRVAIVVSGLLLAAVVVAGPADAAAAPADAAAVPAHAAAAVANAAAPATAGGPTAVAPGSAIAGRQVSAGVGTGVTPAGTLPLPRGGTVTGPTSVPAPPTDIAPGDVCAFGLHLRFPVNQQQAYTYTDASGRTVAEYVRGRLVGVVTRTDTGRSVVRDLSGQGVFTYRADGSSNLTGYGSALVGFHAGDTPSHELLVLDPHGFASIEFAPDGTRTLLFGGGEDLCHTLA